MQPLITGGSFVHKTMVKFWWHPKKNGLFVCVVVFLFFFFVANLSKYLCFHTKQFTRRLQKKIINLQNPLIRSFSPQLIYPNNRPTLALIYKLKVNSRAQCSSPQPPSTSGIDQHGSPTLKIHNHPNHLLY